MKKGTKIGIGIGCSVLLIGAIAITVGGYFAINYLEKTVGENYAKFEAEGREFGANTDQQGCMDEGMRRSKSAGLIDLSGGLQLASFTDACLKASRATAGFCDGVPSLWSMKESEWGSEVCRKAGLDPEKTGCVHVTKRKHDFCSKPLK